MKAYKRSVAGRYQIIKPSRLLRDISKGKMWVSAKVDGQLWFLTKEAGEVALCSYNGRVLVDIPVTREAERLLSSTDQALIAGELFLTDQDRFSRAPSPPPKAAKDAKELSEDDLASRIGPELGTATGRVRVHGVARALADGQLAGSLGFAVFDLLEEDSRDLTGNSYEERLTRMNTLFKDGERMGVVPTVIAGEASEVAACYKAWVGSQKAEGLVVRKEQGMIYKIKPILTVDAVVVGFGERATLEEHDVGQLVVALRRDDGHLQVLGLVGGGFSDEERVIWHQRLKAIEVGSGFRMANRDGTLCRFVRPEIVVELKCSDLISLDAYDRPIHRMVLTFDPQEGYSAVGRMPFLSLIHPVFIGERPDKVPDVAYIGLDQAYSVVPFEERSGAPRPAELPAAKVLEREVYTKLVKEQNAVRKYVALATNKTDQDARYPPFVVHFTDFSPSRTEPLKTSISIAPTSEAQQAQIAAWKAKNLKKGWEAA